jgi:hypothetical protein
MDCIYASIEAEDRPVTVTEAEAGCETRAARWPGAPEEPAVV